MNLSDRRLGYRVPLEIFVNQYVQDQPFRALTSNLSDSGLHVQLVNAPKCTPRDRKSRVVGLEFELPGTGDVIWARGLICYAGRDEFVHKLGIKFTAMPQVHARMVRDWCVETRHQHLATMLQRIAN